MTELMQQIEETINLIKTLMNERYNEVSTEAISILGVLVQCFHAAYCNYFAIITNRNDATYTEKNKTQFVIIIWHTPFL